MCAGNPIIWESIKQSIIALSTCETKYIAAIYAAQQVSWLRKILEEIESSDITKSPPISIIIDNHGVIALVKLEDPNQRTRYINIRYHYIRDYIKNEIIQTHYTPTNEILANDFIKTLNRLKFSIFTASIGMHR
jgi:hypothetical protein